MFLIEPYKFYQKDLCDKCVERNKNKKLNMINENKISVQIVADSIDDKGNRITSFLVVFPRMILAEVNTHRMFTKSTSSCLSGDTLITFDLPTKKSNSNFKSYKMRLDDFVNRYLHGIKKRKRHNYTVNLQNRTYSAKEISEITGKNVNNIRSVCRSGVIKVLNPDKKRNEDFLINGLNYNDYHNGYEIRNCAISRYSNMQIRVLNEKDGTFYNSTVSNVFESGIKDIYEIELENGYKLKCTAQHRIFTDEGWKTLEDINVHTRNNITFYDKHTFKVATNGLKVSIKDLEIARNKNQSLTEFCEENNLNFKQMSSFCEKNKFYWKKKGKLPNETFEYKNKEWLLKQKKLGLTNGRIAELCNTTEDRVKKSCRKLDIKGFVGTILKNEKKRVPWNTGLKYSVSEKSLLSIRKANKKKFKKGSYKKYRDGNKTTRFLSEIRYELINKGLFKCCITGHKQNLHMHHIDPVWNNSKREFDETNIIPMHKKLHRKLHSKNLDLEFLKWYNEGKDLSKFFDYHKDVKILIDDIKKPRAKDRTLMCKYYKIKNITYVGKEETYDLEISGEYHNFIANGFVVHNSRAVPFNKMIEVVEKEPFIPIAWQKVHKGMQGTEYLGEEYSKSALNNWLKARDFAVTQAKNLNSDSEVTKQLCNRLLEPFMWTTMLLTTSEEGLQNFFNLRCPRYKIYGAEDYYMSKYEAMKFNKDTHDFTELDWLKHNEGQAEIHMMDLAEKMYDTFTTNTPKKLISNEWHIPFREKIIGSYGQLSDNNLIKISVAMSAHTSYTTIEGAKKRKIGDWIGLFERLSKQDPPHSSPMEHCCVCVSERDYKKSYKGLEQGWFRNYKGFKSYRQIIEEKL